MSSHSIRCGLATSAAQTAEPLHVILYAGRWKQTNTVMEYIEINNRQTENAAKMILASVTVKQDLCYEKKFR